MKIIGIIIAAAALISLVFFLRWGQAAKLEQTAGRVKSTVEKQVAETIPISVEYLRSQEIRPSPLTIEEDLGAGSSYHEYIASYKSEGNKIYGLLTVPVGQMPEGGWPAIVFNHGYIPPAQYVTTERYIAYVDYLASNGFVVFKIDYRGNGRSEGRATGSYFSPGYTLDAIAAVKSLQTYGKVNPGRIGMWGHSMSGNATLRAMEVSPDIKAGVIWAGAVYSYADMAKYGIRDSSYNRQSRPTPTPGGNELTRRLQQIRTDPDSINFAEPLWQAVSLTANLKHLKAPLQINHAVDDTVVNIGYSRDLAQALEAAGKKYEFYEYDGGGHNIDSPYFETAMERTVQFFKTNL